ncbi:hypothetical protein P7C00_14755 [Pseudomonas sp. JDS08PS003]|uniref:hypothetical protein n=1 Tax=Pseudomonas sp. JDS08PS003 TaxID=2497162 RepID=UPI0038579472
MPRIQTLTPCLWFNHQAQMICAPDPSRSQRMMQALPGIKNWISTHCNGPLTARANTLSASSR